MTYRTFGQRLFIVMWCLAALLSCGIAAVVVFDAVTYREGWIVRGTEQRLSPGAPVANEEVMQAYFAGRMSALERRQFEEAVRTGHAGIPDRHSIGQQGGYEISWKPMTWLLGSLTLVYIIGFLAQFLFLGYGSPIRLIRRDF